MKKFNTHGGYFSPQGYLRINEGGSHEENPNGGVQLGTDGQGIPNMLEENEPVYNDFVYSDNVRASAEMLRKHKLPEKFSGKLFSEIADSFVDEAAERPNDPVSNNGLNAMLVRLADAQEEQKQADEQAALEEEIADLSPEEQEELMRILAQQEESEQAAQIQQAIPAEQMPAGQVAVPQQVMADGGPLRSGFVRVLGDGTPGTVVPVTQGSIVTVTNLDTGETYQMALPDGMQLADPEPAPVYGGELPAARVVAFPGKTQAWVDAEVGPEGRQFKQKIADGRRRFAKGAYDVFNEAKLPFYFVPGVGQVLSAHDAVHSVATGNPKEAAFSIIPFLPKGAKKMTQGIKKMTPKKKWLIGLGVNGGLSAAGYGAWKAYDIWGNAPSNEVVDEYQIESDLNDYATGGFIRRFDMGSPGEVVVTTDPPEDNDGIDYYDDMKSGRLPGYYLPPTLDGQATDVPIPYSPEGYEAERQEQREKQDKSSAESVAAEEKKAAKTGESVDVDASIPPILLRGAYTSAINGKTKVGVSVPPLKKPEPILSKEAMEQKREALKKQQETNQEKKETKRIKEGYVNTLLRYGDIMTNGLMGLYNAFQQPDRYTMPKYTPTLPTGRLVLTNPVYNPVDENRMVNAVLANAAGTRRALLNAGAGPSVVPTLLSQNYITGQNIGTARLQAQEVNTQRYNDVIAKRNANATAIADHRLSMQRAGILNDAQLQNMQNILNLQKLNNAADSEKAAAISNSLNAVGRGLSDIGTENFRLNMANSLSDYEVGDDGKIRYNGENEKKKNGGFLKRYKK